MPLASSLREVVAGDSTEIFEVLVTPSYALSSSKIELVDYQPILSLKEWVIRKILIAYHK